MGRKRRTGLGRARSGLAAAVILLAAPAPILAESSANTPFRVTVNHAKVITLSAPAAVALIADPDIADIVNERNNLIFVLGRKPGATNLLVYDHNGKRLFGREIVVAPEDASMVTITRETDVTDYYCTPLCRFYEHEQGGAPLANAGAPASTGAAQAGVGAAAQPSAAPGQAPAGSAPYMPSVILRPGNS